MANTVVRRIARRLRLVNRRGAPASPGLDELGRIRFYSNAKAYALMKKYMCLICGHIYDEALGDPDTGVAPGTKWEDVPPNWTCPDCGARKEDYELVEF
jgi:rubredoxin